MKETTMTLETTLAAERFSSDRHSGLPEFRSQKERRKFNLIGSTSVDRPAPVPPFLLLRGGSCWTYV
jgi:hypothetical protein